jgi:hypothetical protein
LLEIPWQAMPRDALGRCGGESCHLSAVSLNPQQQPFHGTVVRVRLDRKATSISLLIRQFIVYKTFELSVAKRAGLVGGIKSSRILVSLTLA